MYEPFVKYSDTLRNIISFLSENEQYGDDWTDEIDALEEMLDFFDNTYPNTIVRNALSRKVCRNICNEEIVKLFTDSELSETIVNEGLARIEDNLERQLRGIQSAARYPKAPRINVTATFIVYNKATQLFEDDGSIEFDLGLILNESDDECVNDDFAVYLDDSLTLIRKAHDLYLLDYDNDEFELSYDLDDVKAYFEFRNVEFAIEV